MSKRESLLDEYEPRREVKTFYHVINKHDGRVLCETTREQAEGFVRRAIDPISWKVVKQEVVTTYGEMEEVEVYDE